MTLLLVALAVLAVSAAGYLWIGFRVARPYVAREVQRLCERWEVLPGKYPMAAGSPTVERWRRVAAAEAVFLAFVWPFYLAWRGLYGRMAATSPLSAYELKLQLAERDRRIADLERQLGMNNNTGTA